MCMSGCEHICQRAGEDLCEYECEGACEQFSGSDLERKHKGLGDWEIWFY